MLEEEEGVLKVYKSKELYPGVFQLYSYLNLVELRKMYNAVKKKRRIPNLMIESLLSEYQGTTIFSLFLTEPRVLDNIDQRFEQMDLNDEDDFVGRDN